MQLGKFQKMKDGGCSTNKERWEKVRNRGIIWISKGHLGNKIKHGAC